MVATKSQFSDAIIHPREPAVRTKASAKGQFLAEKLSWVSLMVVENMLGAGFAVT
jgi:hypothetical protein